MKKVMANIRFKDTQCNNKQRVPGDVWTVSDNRAWVLTQTMYENRTYYCDYAEMPWKDNDEPHIIIYNYDLYKIGGTETFLYNLCKYYKDKNIILVYRTGKPEFINLLRTLVPVFRDNGKRTYDCDVLLMGNYFSQDIVHRVTAKQKYQMIHADYSGMKEAGFNINLVRPKDTKLISVSDTAAGGLKREFGYDSIVQYNILDKDISKEKPTVFISLTRATKEKGIHRIIALSKLFKKYNKNFLWLLCGTVSEQSNDEIKKQIEAIPEIMLIPPSPNNKKFIEYADYLVQLSDTESFCYSAYEALIMGKPVIITDFPEANNIVNQGKNGYIIPMDTQKYDKKLVDKIFDKIPTEITYEDRCNYDLWEKIFAGEEVGYER